MVDLSIVTLVYLSSYVKLCQVMSSYVFILHSSPWRSYLRLDLPKLRPRLVVSRWWTGIKCLKFHRFSKRDIMISWPWISRKYIYIKYNKTTGDINSIRFDYSINQPKLGHVNNPSDDKSSPFSLKAKPIEETAGRTNQNTPGGRLQIADWRCKVIPDRIVNHSKSLLIVWWFTFLCFGDTVCTWSHLKYLHTGPWVLKTPLGLTPRYGGNAAQAPAFRHHIMRSHWNSSKLFTLAPSESSKVCFSMQSAYSA